MGSMTVPKPCILTPGRADARPSRAFLSTPLSASTMSQRVLMIEDDQRLASMVSTYLTQNGYEVVHAATAKAGVALLQAGGVALVLLDLMLPDADGLEVCRRIRALPAPLASVAIVMLTAKGDPMDRVIGLELGADDYLPKPFEPRELLARIRSVLRRSHAMPSNAPSDNAQQMRFSGWTLDLTARHLLNPDGIVIMLSGAEFRLLRVFLEHPNRVLNRDQLLNLTQGRDADPFDRSIDIQISRLRQKLGEDARLPQIIKTVRNGGYVLAGQVTVEPSA
jgi:two-component system OmpR family response regulator